MRPADGLRQLSFDDRLDVRDVQSKLARRSLERDAHAARLALKLAGRSLQPPTRLFEWVGHGTLLFAGQPEGDRIDWAMFNRTA